MWQVLPGGGADFERDTRAYEGAARGGQVASIDDLDIQPGDIVVIDNNRGTYGDHITQCRSYNRSTHMLQTIGGNEGGAHPVNIGRWHTLDENPEPVANKHSGDGHARVYAVGRFSAVDYETHDYRAPPRGH